MDETTVDARFIHGRIKSGGQVMQGKRPGLIMVLMASIGLALPQFPAGAQLLGPVERTVGGLADTVTDTLSSGLGATERLTEDARDLTRTRLRGLLRSTSSALEADRRGFPVVRGEVVALSPRSGTGREPCRGGEGQ